MAAFFMYDLLSDNQTKRSDSHLFLADLWFSSYREIQKVRIVMQDEHYDKFKQELSEDNKVRREATKLK